MLVPTPKFAPRTFLVACLIAAFCLTTNLAALAGGLVRAPAVGGVYIDAEGVVSAPAVDDSESLQAVWQAGLQPVPAELEPLTDLRFVSLRKLEDQIAQAEQRGEPLPDEVRYLAGLLRVKHVLVYPKTPSEPGDIVLAGPAEGWRVDALGNTVGVTTGRPVLMLEDLVSAIRTSENANGAGISCSIDPTQEGLARAQRVQSELPVGVSPRVASRRLEQALGRQVIRVTGVPATSHFARTLVAADFRMKRLAMGFEGAESVALPSYVQMMNPRSAGKNLLPRWWLAANYEPLARDAEGLAWEIRGQGVKCMAEQDLVDAAGNVQRNQGAPRDARRWADLFTENFEEVANHDSAFGHLRNAMDLSVVAALLLKEGLWEVAGVEAPQLTAGYELEEYEAPREVATTATLLKKGDSWVITASGGVQVFPWEIADKTEVAEGLVELKQSANQTRNASWWWQ